MNFVKKIGISVGLLASVVGSMYAMEPADNNQEVALDEDVCVSSLHNAIRSGDVLSVRNLLEFGLVNSNCYNAGITPLMRAICYQSDDRIRYALVELLLAHGADVRKKDSSGKTATQYAFEQLNSSKEQQKAVQQLLLKKLVDLQKIERAAQGECEAVFARVTLSELPVARNYAEERRADFLRNCDSLWTALRFAKGDSSDADKVAQQQKIKQLMNAVSNRRINAWTQYDLEYLVELHGHPCIPHSYAHELWVLIQHSLRPRTDEDYESDQSEEISQPNQERDESSDVIANILAGK